MILRSAKVKITQTSGLIRAALVLLVAIAVMLVIVLVVPLARNYKASMDYNNCVVAMKTIQDDLDMEYLASDWTDLDEETVRSVAEVGKWARAKLCPSGGDCYFILDDTRTQPVRVVCGLHETDLKLRTRVNARGTLNKVIEQVQYARRWQGVEPESVTVEYHSGTLTAIRVDSEPDLKRGTYTTPGYEGVVAYYMLDENGVSFYCYADDDHCGLYHRGAGWTGDAFEP